MSNKSTMLRFITATLIIALTTSAGCGLLSFRNPEFDNAETGEDGQSFTLNDLEVIADDPDLTDDEKRDAFNEMGVEDQNLIDALLG